MAKHVTAIDVLLRPGEAARRLGLTVTTLQRMEREGNLRGGAHHRKSTAHPRGDGNRLTGEREVRELLLYARVSCPRQMDDLERLEKRLLRTDPGAEFPFDIRSGLKFDRPGFLRALKAVQGRRVSRGVALHEDHLSRFGVELLRQNFAADGATLEVMEPKAVDPPEYELAQILISIIPPSRRGSTVYRATRPSNSSPPLGRC